jgi:ribose 5-phosphate isomerase B
MKIAVGSDHRGIEIKKLVIKILQENGHTHQDFGAYNTDAVDYPDIAQRVGEAVTKEHFDRGIVICDTGIGMSIAANKVKGVRAALCYDSFCAYRARLHNDANVIALGSRCNEETIREILDKFLTTQFEGGRHQRRLDKINEMERRY